MTREEVVKKMEEFLEYMRREEELREELASLEFLGDSDEETQRSIELQDKLMEEIELLRKEKMLPILEEIADFIAARSKELQREEK